MFKIMLRYSYDTRVYWTWKTWFYLHTDFFCLPEQTTERNTKSHSTCNTSSVNDSRRNYVETEHCTWLSQNIPFNLFLLTLRHLRFRFRENLKKQEHIFVCVIVPLLVWQNGFSSNYCCTHRFKRKIHTLAIKT